MPSSALQPWGRTHPWAGPLAPASSKSVELGYGKVWNWGKESVELGLQWVKTYQSLTGAAPGVGTGEEKTPMINT